MMKATKKKVLKPVPVLWIGDNAECGEKWGRLWYTLELEDGAIGYAFISGSTNKVVTKRFKSKSVAKKAAEKWLRAK